MGGRWLLVVLAALSLVLAGPTAALGRAMPSALEAATRATPSAPFTLDLSTTGDFVAQTNFVQCVGASMQMMLNMIRPKDDRTPQTQLELQILARSLSGQRPDRPDRQDRPQRQGASVRGWTAGLNALGYGPYRMVGATDIGAALRAAARAMRETNRPVGLLVWRGRHAWVMAGFTSTADPRFTDDYEVTSVIVLDPLYPHGSRIWGPSAKPRQSLTLEELGRQFVPRGFRGSIPGGGTEPLPTAGSDPEPGSPGGSPDASRYGGLAGKYVIVMPFTKLGSPGAGQAVR